MSNPGKKRRKSPFLPPTEQPPPEEESTPGPSKGKLPMRPLPEQPVQASSRSENPRHIPLEKSIQANLNPTQPHPEQRVQHDTKGKQAQEAPAKQPGQGHSEGKQPQERLAKQTEHGDPKGKQPQEHSAKQSSKGKQPQEPSAKQSVQEIPKAKQPQEHSAKQISTDKQLQEPSAKQSVKETPKGKQPQEHSAKQIPTDKQLQEPSAKQTGQVNPKSKQPQEPPAKQPVQGNSKGKQPMQALQPPSKQASSRSENPQQLPIDKSKQAMSDPKQQVQRDTKGKQPRHQESQARNPVESQSKGKQSESKTQPVYGNPNFYIARIPVERDATIKRVKVSITPDTMFRHPQTLFFKNLPGVEPYWGTLNDAASTAKRIVRLENGGRPTPYFLMACSGEYPEVESPRNDNNMFVDMYVPIFGDAFVFKLGEPELFGEGYSRFDHVEKNIGSFDWLPEAIREAARKVEFAMARHANAGFPDIMEYTDPDTRSKDACKMIRWIFAIRRARKKYGDGMPVDATYGPQDLEGMEDVLTAMNQQVDYWTTRALLQGSKGSDFAAADNYAWHAFTNINACRKARGEPTIKVVNGTSSASTLTGSPEIKTTDPVEEAKNLFTISGVLWSKVQTIADENRKPKKARPLNVNGIRKEIEELRVHVEDWKKANAFPIDPDSGSCDLSMADDFMMKADAASQALEEGRIEAELIEPVTELKKCFILIEAVCKRNLVVMRVKAAIEDAARKDDEGGSSNDSTVTQGRPEQNA